MSSLVIEYLLITSDEEPGLMNVLAKEEEGAM